MKAELIIRESEKRENGTVHAVVWKVPEPVSPSEHPFKYRLAYVVKGERVIGYDNERGKGDHKHINGKEMNYSFTGVDQLVLDFLQDIERWDDEKDF